MQVHSVTEIAETQAEAAQAAGAKAQSSSVNKETFLQLLVAQIRNQDPLNPADSVEFLTQLAQFSQLEQLIEIRSELSQLRESGTPGAAKPPASGATTPAA